jgi:peptidoglycan/LPS O-acetylase OafA/YrhL
VAGGSGHRADIQGLRAVAVLLVVLAHAGVGFLPGGFVGVDVFFVLSGFLITGLLLAEARASGSVSLLEFYVRRARRILPAAALTLLATDIAAFLLLNFVRARQAVEDSLHAAAFAANFRFSAHEVDYFARAEPPSPVLHYWSLAVEEQFYVVWPLLLSIALFGVALGRRRRGAGEGRERRLLALVLVLTGASLAWSIHATATLPDAAYFSPFTRAWELGIGAALAVGASTLALVPPIGRLVMGWAGLLAIASAAVLFSDATPFPGSAALLPTIGTALALAAGIGPRGPRLAVARLLAIRPMRVIGDRSYALYLWHWPVLILADQFVGHELTVPVKLGLVAGAFLLSCLSYAFVENPIRRRVRSRAATAVVVAVSTAAILGTASVALAAIDREQQRFEGAAGPAAPVAGVSVRAAPGARGALPEVVAAVEAARRGDPVPAGLTPPISRLRDIPAAYALPRACFSTSGSPETTSKICRLGALTSRKLLVLMGDSHAKMWLPSVLELARRDGWVVIPLLRTGCMPNWWVTASGPATCRTWYAWAMGQVRRLRPRVTLLGGSIAELNADNARAGVDGIIGAATLLKRFGRVVVIGDPEGLTFDPVDCLLARDASMKKCTTAWPAAAFAAYGRIALRAKQVGVGFLGTRGFLCHERQCPAVIRRTIAYSDNSHITAAYAIQVTGAFQARFVEATASARR